MNSIRAIQSLNKRELENNVSTEASWHADYRDTAYVYIGGLPFDLSEGDILTIFSQYGEPTYLNLIRDRESGKSKGFCFLKYEDQRSTDLAVDNLGGATIMGRVLKVDHTRYKKKEGEEETGLDLAGIPENGNGTGQAEEGEEERRPMLREEKELMALMRDHDEDDPMKEFLVQEKKEEVAKALARVETKKPRDRKHRHHHRKQDHRSHKSKRHSDSSGSEEDRHKKHRSSRRRSRSH